jgi:uncharacterized protein (TIGR02246 family)
MKRLVGFLVVLALGVPATSYAQDADLRAQAEQGNAAYAEAWAAGDVDGLLAMFTDDAIFWPPGGGRYEGKDEIRQALEEEPTPTSASIQSTHVERLGDLIFDVGTFTVTMPEEAGGETHNGEYAAVLTEEGDEILIQRLIGFPVREAPTAQ